MGARARKINQGILTVRFEMPFAVWCTTCPQPTLIAQGVRFNAEKKKVGSYYSSPIYSFRMTHAACGGTLEIRTDPQHTAYVVTEGGRKRDTGEDRDAATTAGGEITVLTEEERERRRNDAFAALEGTTADKRRAAADGTRIRQLAAHRERGWADPYARSQTLRRAFRAERKVREADAARTEALRERMGLAIELLDETEDDRRRAALVQFGGSVDADSAVERARVRSLAATKADATATTATTAAPAAAADGGVFVRATAHEKKKKKRKSKSSSTTDSPAVKKMMLQKEVQGNTLASLDPFLVNHEQWGSAGNSLRQPSGLKGRLLHREEVPELKEIEDATESGQSDSPRPQLLPADGLPGLVDYDSD